jgi:hypothetical protein
LIDPDDTHDGVFRRREVLLVERRTSHGTELLNARFSSANYRRIEPGMADGKKQIVLWSAMNDCGSCHSGPEGLLMWNPLTRKLEWNEHWSKVDSKAIVSALPENYYLDEAESLFWDESRSALYLRADIHKDTDPHCCSNGGWLDAAIDIRGTVPHLTEIIYTPPSIPSHTSNQ